MIAFVETLLYYFRILTVEIKRLVLAKLRYPVETITELLSLLGFFIFIAFSVGLTDIEKTNIVFFICTFFALPSLQGPYKLTADEGNFGSSEYVFALPVQVPTLIFLKDIAVGLISLPQFLLALLIIYKIFGTSYLKIPLILAMVSLRIGTLGIGLIFAGIALTAKRLGSLMNLFSVLMLSSTFIFKALGIKLADKLLLYSSSLRYLSAAGESKADLIGMISIAIVYLIFGTMIFKMLENRAKKIGILGR